MWGQPPSAVCRPKGRLVLARAATMKAVPSLLNIRHLNIEFLVQGANTAARAAGQPQAAVSTKSLPAVRDLSFSIAPGEVETQLAVPPDQHI